MGLVTGMQAIVNDANSGAMAGIPRNIAPQAERAVRCVENEKWGGVPNAVRALVWLLLPDTRPPMSPDPWQVLEHSRELGFDRGFRVASAPSGGSRNLWPAGCAEERHSGCRRCGIGDGSVFRLSTVGQRRPAGVAAFFG